MLYIKDMMTLELSPLFITLKVAGLATLLALVMGTLAAYVLAKHSFPGKEMLDTLFTLPMVLPPTVLGYYLLVSFGRNGFPGRWLEHVFGVSLVFTWQGAVLAAAVVSLPLVQKSARAAFEGVDGTLQDAARTLGKSEPEVFLLVTLPLAWRVILSGVMLAFARAVGEFGATLMIAGNLPGRTQTLSLAIYDAVQSGNDSLGTVLVLTTSSVCAGVLLLSKRLLKTEV